MTISSSEYFYKFGSPSIKDVCSWFFTLLPNLCVNFISFIIIAFRFAIMVEIIVCTNVFRINHNLLNYFRVKIEFFI